ncbi:hypothetical protein SUGI_0048130 [Cryptomeria japonica]|nr:hypothetical protein SUGI_0048130 [Cryptomeria japonica]
MYIFLPGKLYQVSNGDLWLAIAVTRKPEIDAIVLSQGEEYALAEVDRDFSRSLPCLEFDYYVASPLNFPSFYREHKETNSVSQDCNKSLYIIENKVSEKYEMGVGVSSKKKANIIYLVRPDSKVEGDATKRDVAATGEDGEMTLYREIVKELYIQ